MIALRTYTARKKRTFLTMIGIFIGIAAIVSLISLGQGLQESVTAQFEQMGVDKIMIMNKAAFLGIGDKIFTNDDVDEIRSVKGVKRAGGFIYKALRVELGDETKYTFVTGMPQDETKELLSSMSNFKIKYGRDLRKNDRYKAIAGIWLYEGKFFEKALRPGDTINVEGKKFTIVGFMDQIGNPQDDSQLIVTIDVARDIMNDKNNLDIVMAQVSDGVNIATVAEGIEKKLRKSRGFEEDEEDFSVQTSEELMESFASIFNIISAVLIGIAIISLLVGGIGIMNTMYTSVLERTQEIGIMKAIGARNSDILSIFLIESGIIGIAGGLIGVAIGMGMSKLVELASHAAGITLLTAYFSWELLAGALAFSFIVGVLSGVLPAKQASKLITADALRYE